MLETPIAVLGLGLYFPERTLSSVDLARRASLPVDFVEDVLGVRRIYVPGPDDHPCAMGVRAARRALRRAGLDARELDLVLYVGTDYKEHIHWTAALKLQHDLGATRAFAFDVHQTCTGLLMGLRVAQAMMRADSTIGSVLLAGGHRSDHVDHENPLTQFLLNSSAGGGAMVLRRSSGGIARLLETHVMTDGALCESMLIPAGGTKLPTTEDRSLRTITLVEPEKVREHVAAHLVANTARCARMAIEASGRTVTDLSFFAGNHARIDQFLALLEALHLTEEQTVYLEDHGHIGPFDPLCALEFGARLGRLRRGDLAVCAGAGLAFSWAATALEWQIDASDMD
jgi:3-oxoacyl-[acyl-carrier-protein] synthase-3